jgi:hypothetical protein
MPVMNNTGYFDWENNNSTFLFNKGSVQYNLTRKKTQQKTFKLSLLGGWHFAQLQTNFLSREAEAAAAMPT